MLPGLPLLLSLPLAVASGPAFDTTNWFTVAGDPLVDTVNTVQVDPVAQTTEPRTMRVRVSRAAPRISWDGVRYQSYEAQVLFDCRKPSARYLSIRYHLAPRWLGPPHQTMDYTTGEPRLMQFREVEPNPMARIIAAACTPLPRHP